MIKTTIPAMIRRHGELIRLTDGLYAARGDAAADSPEYHAAMVESIDLGHRIVATTPRSRADLAAKRKFIRETDFISDSPGLDTGDLDRLVAMILSLDAKAIGGGVKVAA